MHWPPHSHPVSRTGDESICFARAPGTATLVDGAHVIPWLGGSASSCVAGEVCGGSGPFNALLSVIVSLPCVGENLT